PTDSPDLPKPLAVVRLRDDRERTHRVGRAPVATRLPLEEYVFSVVLDDSVRLVGLSEETAAVAGRLQLRIRDLIPDDRGEVVEPEKPAPLLYARVEREHRVTSELAARHAHVSYNDDESTAWH